MPSPRRKRLYEEIAEVLKKAILSGDYRVGDKLPSEMELAERFGVSRLVVREAIRYLELNGLIEVRQGATGGAFVRELDSKIIRQNLSDLLFFRKISVTQLYEVRMYVEPEVARLAALRRTEEDLQLLEHLVYLSETGEPGIDYIKHNVDFHRVLGKASQNPFYAVIINSIMDFTENFILTIKPVKEVIHERTIHREIYEAILKRNADQARAKAIEHTINITKQMKRLEKLYLDLLNAKLEAEYRPYQGLLEKAQS